MKNKKIALHWKIIIGMVAGILFALFVSNFSWGPGVIKDWIKPFGTIFINALKLIAVPLILASLIKGISDLGDITKLSKMGTTTIFTFIFTTFLAVSIGLILVNIIKPGEGISEETRANLLSSYAQDVSGQIEQAKEQTETGPLKALEDLVPSNIFFAASDNTKMLQVICFAVLLGISLILVPVQSAKPVKDFFASLNEIILKMIDLIMLAAPYGVFALLAALVVESPSTDLFSALALYAITVIIGLLSMLGVYSGIVWFSTRTAPKIFIKAIAPAQLLAFSTSSSAATLPVTLDCVQNKLDVPEEVASFVLPIGATINMDGTSLYQAVAAVFIAQAFGMDLSLGAQLMIIVTATLASIGSAAVPGAGMVMLVIVLAQAGIPEAGLALIFAVDRPLDMCRTVVNISGDAAVSVLIARMVHK